jgi:hypothetical protein
MTGPESGVRPFLSISTIERAAVKPAVPIVIDSKGDIPAGRGTSQSAGTRTSWAYPPSWATPRSWPVAMTWSPLAKRGSVLSRTIPAASMPPISGKRRMILPAPVPARASL